LTSCNGQTNKQQAKKDNISKGDTLTELGNSIMVVYQDNKHIYWFGSWETGVYKYDGKTLINYTTEHGLPNNRIDEIREDKSGNIYFTSCHPNSTVTRFDGNTFTTLSATPGTDWQLNHVF
jgi:sugar lactone lactonase YvrE